MAASLESIEKFTKELYRSSNFADLTLKLKDDKEIKVHKSVVCRSSFFKSACMSGFKEASEGVINFPEADPLALQVVIMSLYTFKLKECLEEIEKGTDRASPDFNVLIKTIELAEMYGLTKLASLCVDQMKTWLDEAIDGGKTDTFWDFAACIWDKDKMLVGGKARILLNSTFQNHAKQFIDLKSQLYDRFRTYPRLACDLLVLGGLDGTGLHNKRDD